MNTGPAQKFNASTVSVSKAAKIVGISPSSLRRLEANAEITAVRLPNGYRVFKLQDLHKLKTRLASGSVNKRVAQEISPVVGEEARPAIPAETIELSKKLEHQAQTYNTAKKGFMKSGKHIGVAFALHMVLLAGFYAYTHAGNGSLRKNADNFIANLREDAQSEESQVKGIANISEVLGQRDQASDFLFQVNIPTNLGGGLTTPSIGGVSSIDATTQATISNSLVLGGDITGTLGNATIATGSIDGSEFANTVSFGGVLNLSGELQTDGTSGEDGQILSSTGSGLAWIDPETDAETLSGLDAEQFLRSDTNDTFESGTLSFTSGTLLDLSAITQNSTTPQGLRLPQASTLSLPSIGEGYLAYDTDDDKILIYNGTAWVDVSGASTTLQQAYEAGSTIVLSATQGDIQVTNDSANEILFLDEDTGRVGIGTTSPSSKLHVAGTVTALDVDAGTATITTLDGTTLTYTTANLTTANVTTLDLGTNTISDGSFTGNWNFNSGTVSGISTLTADTAVATPTINASGDLSVNAIGGQLELADSVTLNVGGINDVAYNAFANAGDAPEEAGISSDNDLYIGGDLEVDGTIFGNVSGEFEGSLNPGFATGSVVFIDSAGLAEDNANFFWDDTQNRLGIGTNSPDSALDVNGTITATTITDGSISISGGQIDLGSNIISDGNFFGNWNFNSGNISIANNLDAAGIVTFTGLSGDIDNTVLILSSANQVATREIDPRVWGTSIVDYSGTNTNYIAKFSDADTLTQSVIYETGGNIGIGTTGPDRKVDILAAAAPQLRLTQTDGSVYADFQVDSNGDLIVGVDSSTNQLILDNGGNVGIGTVAPASLLSVGATSQFQVNSSGIISAIDGVAHTIDDVGGNLTLSSNSATISLNDSTNITGSLDVSTAISAGTADAFTVDTSGNVTGASFADGTAALSGGILDLGTNTISDGNFTGNWDFNSGNLTNIGNLTAAGTITLSGLSSGATDTILILNGSNQVNTRSIDARVWGTGLVDSTSATATFIPFFSDANTITDSVISQSGGDILVGGNLALGNTYTMQVGGLTGTDYNAFANAGDAPDEAGISSDNDLYIGGDLEVDGTIYGTISGNAVGGFTEGSVIFADSAGNLDEDNTNFFWDDTQDFLGIGNAAPASELDVTGTITATVLTDGTATLTAGDLTGIDALSAGGTITLTGLGTGTDNTVLILNSSNQLTTDEIDPRAWGSSLVDSTTGQAGYVAYFTDGDTLGAEQYLSTSRGGLGANITAAGAGEVLYSTGTTAYDSLAAGNSGELLTSGGAGAPTWTNIASLLTAGDDIDITGTTNAQIDLEDDVTLSAIRASGAGGLGLYDDGTNLGLFVEDGGQVGIGTTSPEAAFEIQGAEGADAVLALDADEGDDAGDTWFIKALATGNSLSIMNESTEVAAISTTGDLQVDGTVTAVGFDDGTASLSAGTLDLGTNTISDGNFTGNWNFNSGNLSGINNITAGGIITLSGLSSDTDNTVLILNSSNQVATREIDSRVWGTSLVDYSGSNANYIPRFSDTDTLTQSVIYADGTDIGIGVTDATDKLHVVGDVLATAGFHVGADSTDNLIDDTSNGSGSTTLYIGNESILASGDIGVSVQAYNADTSILGSSIEGSEIADGTIEEVDLEVTNSPTDDYILSYDSASGGFTWITNDGGSGASKWTDDGAFTYLTETSDDLVLGGSTITDASFFFDVSSGNIVLEGATADGFETTLSLTDPTADNTITIPDASGEISLLGQSIATAEITDDTILAVDLDSTNSATDAYVLAYDLGSGGFTWVDPSGLGTASGWTDTGSALYVTNTAYDLIVGGSSIASSMFAIDESDGNFYFASDNSANPTFLFEATDSDAGSFGFNTNDSFFFTGGNVGIGNTNPGTLLGVGSTSQFAVDGSGNVTGVSFTDGTATLSAGTLDLGTNTIADGTITGNWDFNTGSLTNIAGLSADGTVTFSALGTDGVVTVTSGVLSSKAEGAGGGLDADTLDSISSGSFLRSDTSDNFTSGTLTTDSGTTLDVNGDIAIADTSIPFDGASTAFVFTGDFAANTDDLFIEKATGEVGIGITSPTDALHVFGNVLATAGFHVGVDGTNTLIDDASNGSGSTTLYIGNESILASGDIGVSVQGYDANTSILGSSIEGSEVADGTIEEVDLEVTNSPTDDYILTYDTATGGFTWVDPTTVGSGTVDGTGSANYLTKWVDANTVAASSILYEDSNNLFLGDTANTGMTQGLTINQGSADNEILALKSSDVAHGLTSLAETDTFGTLKKAAGVAGGLEVYGLRDADGGASEALVLRGVLQEAANNGKSTTNQGVINIVAQITDGSTGATGIATDGNLLSVRNNSTTRLIIDAEGTIHQIPGSDADVNLLTVQVTGTPTLSWDESDDGFDLSKGIDITGVASATAGFRVGGATTDYLIDDASNGAGSATLYIGNESILASGDIGVSVQAYNANTSILGSSIETGEIADGTILEADLSATNSATDNYLLTYDNGSGGFTWVDPSTIGGTIDGSGTGNYLTKWADSDTVAASSILYEDSNNLFLGDTANTNTTQGLTINQGANDDQVFALKSSDVAHGITDFAETDTFGSLSKTAATAGGLSITGYRDADGTSGQALNLTGLLGEAADTTKTTAGIGVVNVDSAIKSGTGVTTVGSDGNLLAVRNNGTARLIVDAEGTIHQIPGSDTDTDLLTVQVTGTPTLSWDESDDEFDLTKGIDITGNVLATAGFTVGANSTDNLIDDASNGSGSTTLYIGNESILASGDIGVSVQAYNANTSILGSSIEGSEIADGTIEEVDLEVTNSPTDNWLLTYDLASGGFTWIDPASMGGGTIDGSGTGGYLSLWSDSNTLTDSAFYQDTGSIGLGTTGPDRILDILDASNPQLRLTQTDGSVYADFQVNSNGDLIMGVDGSTNQLVLDNGGNVGIGNAAPTSLLSVGATSQFQVDSSGAIAAAAGITSSGTVTFSGLSTDGVVTVTGGVLGSKAEGAGGGLDADTLDSLSSGSFLRSDTNDSYTSGILTTDSGTTLDVNGDIAIADTSIPFDGASSAFVFTGNWAVNTDDLFIEKSTGEVGIGTATPGALLDVAGTARATTLSDGTATLTGGTLDLGTNTIVDGNLTGNWNFNSGDATGLDAITAGGTITLNGLGTGTDNTVLILNGSNQVTTDEIDSRVWGSSLVDFSSTTAGYIPMFSDSDTITDSVISQSGGNIDIAGDLTVTGGELIFNPLASSASTTEGTVYYDSDVDHLFVRTGDNAFHRLAMDMTQYSDSDSSVDDGDYLEITHNQGTNDITATGWVFNTISNAWEEIQEFGHTIKHALQNEWDDASETGFTVDTNETLKQNLISYWKMDETSGTRVDSFGTNHLTDNNTVTSAAGRRNNAGDFESSNSEFLEIADNASLSTGDISFSVSLWVNMESTASTQVFAGKVDDYALPPPVTDEWAVLYDSGSGMFTFRYGAMGLCAVTGDVPSTGVWYHIVGWRDASTDSCHIVVNDGTVYSNGESGAPADTAANFRIGAWSASETAFADALIDEVGFWKKVLSAQEITDLYNSGNGSTYSSAGNFIRTESKLTNVELSPSIDVGTGADGAITVSGDTDINATSLISGRSCADGGDAVNYSVESLTATTADLESAPSSGCLSVGDEVLLINLRGTYTAYANVGNYETLRVKNISSDVVTFETAKSKYYGDNAGDDTNIGLATGNQAVMLQRVPNYTDVTVTGSGTDFTPAAWVAPTGSANNGAGEGGVMFFRATGTVSVGSGALINANATGYKGTAGASSGDRHGGESFCGRGGDGGDDGAGGGGGPNSADGGGNGYCGGGGGVRNGTPGTGSATAGGAGGGGSSGASSTTYGGGGGGGYGSGGKGGNGTTDGVDGSTNQSGDGGVGNGSAGGGGGGGGTYGNASLDSLFFGSGGGSSPSSGGVGNGGNGGGIVHISANSLSVSGQITSNGSDSTTTSTVFGGAGAGGSIKLMGNSLNIGSSLVNATGGDGGQANDEGDGGSGRIALYYVDNVSGSTSPAATFTNQPYYPYGLYHSPVIATPGSTELESLRWEANLNTYGKIEFQTRSGPSSDPTDGTWEAWKPFTATTNYLDLNTANTHGDWSGTAVVTDGDVTRNVDMFEDEDESTAGNLTKITTSGFNPDTSGTLNTNLVSYWALNETSGTRADAYDNNDLTANGTGGVGSGAGIVSNAADFESSESDFLEIADNADLSTGDIDFTISAWVKLESLGANQMIATKYNSGSVREYQLYYNTSDSRFYFGIFNSSGTAIGETSASSFGAASAATWYHILAWHDSVANTVNIKVNNGTTDSSATSGVPADTAANFRIGARSSTEDTFFDGLIDEVGFWKKVLSAQEITDLYNSGSANSYEDDSKYAEATISSTDLSTYDYVTFWVRASQTGNTVKFGFGESGGTEQEETVTIDAANTWQKVYWDLTDINPAARNAVTKLRFTNLTASSNTIYIDNIRGEKLMSDPNHSEIASTPNEYFQYRAIFTTTNPNYRPQLESVYLNYGDGYEITQPDDDTVRLYNHSGQTQNLRLDVVVFGADLAEWYTVDNTEIEAGNIVALTGENDQYGVPIVGKTTSYGQSGTLGAISTKAGKELGLEKEDRRLVALSGRVPVKVIVPEGESIRAGEYITSSSVMPGYGEKATDAGMVVGMAMESFDIANCTDCRQITLETGETVTTGKILVFMNVMWWGGDGQLAQSGQTENYALTAALETKVNDTTNRLKNIEELLGVTYNENSGELSEGSLASTLNEVSTLSSKMLEIYDNFKTFVDDLGMNMNTETNTLTINANLLATGDATFTNANLTGNLNVGLMQVDSTENSINVLGAACLSDAGGLNTDLCADQTLYLQKGLAGNVDLFDGKVVFEPDGTVNLSKIVIVPNDPSAPSAGTIVITPGETFVIINTTALTPDSKILATPNKPVPVGTEVVDLDSFRINLAVQEPEEIKVDWLIVDAKNPSDETVTNP